MKTINVSVRVPKETGKPELFFWNSNGLGWVWLECYAHIGQHSECSIAYMRQCKPVKTLDAQALALLREWSNLGSDKVSARVVARLARPNV